MSKQPEKETWGPAEVIADQAWDLWAADQECGQPGPSLPVRIIAALRKAGLLYEKGD